MTHWPPITITLTSEGATIYTAGVQTTTLPMSPTIHADALAVARTIAQRYNRALPLSATGPEGTFTMTIDPDGTLTSDSTPEATTGQAETPDPQSTTTGDVETSENITDVPLSLPTPTALPTPPLAAHPTVDAPDVPPGSAATDSDAESESDEGDTPSGPIDIDPVESGPHEDTSHEAMSLPTTATLTAMPAVLDASGETFPPVVQVPQDVSPAGEDEPEEDNTGAPTAQCTPGVEPTSVNEEPGLLSSQEATHTPNGSDAQASGSDTQEIPALTRRWATVGREHATATSGAPAHGAPERSHRKVAGVLAGAVLLLACATGVAVHALDSDDQAATTSPTPLVIQTSPAPSTSPSPSASDAPQSQDSPTPQAITITPTPTQATTQTTQEASAPQPVRTTTQPQVTAQPQATTHAPTQAASTPRQTTQTTAITAMHTSVATSGGGSATMSVTLSGSGSTTITATIAGVSTTLHASAPGTTTATLTGIPTGTQSWQTSAGGLVNSGTITVY